MSDVKVLSLDQGRITQTDVWAAPNFSFRQINLDTQINIPSEEQMLVNNSVRVEGFFRVDGEAYVYDNPVIPELPELPGDNYSHFEVTTQKQIPLSQEMIASSFVRVESELRVLGQMTILGSEPEPETSPAVPNKISANKTFHIGLDFEHYFRDFLSISGALRVSGQFAVGA